MDTSSSRKEAELWRKSKQEPWTGLFNPAVNPRPYLPTTSHYLRTTFSLGGAERTRTRALCGAAGRVEGWTGGGQQRRAVRGGVKRMKTTMFTGQLQKGMDAVGWGRNAPEAAAKKTQVTDELSGKVQLLYAHFDWRTETVHRQQENESRHTLNIWKGCV